jgi:cytochrome c
MANPTLLRFGIGASQKLFGPLHGEAQRVEQFADMARMVMNAKFLPDNFANHGRGPNPALETVLQ